MVTRLHHFTFLRTSLREHLYPKFTRYQLPQHMSRREMDKLRKRHMHAEIKKHYKNLNRNNMELYSSNRCLAEQLHHLELDHIIQVIRIDADAEKTSEKKLNQLREERLLDQDTKPPEPHKYFSRLTNMSSTTFNAEGTELLWMGYKYALQRTTNTAQLALDLEAATRGIPSEKEIRTELILILRNIQRKTEQNGKSRNDIQR